MCKPHLLRACLCFFSCFFLLSVMGIISPPAYGSPDPGAIGWYYQEPGTGRRLRDISGVDQDTAWVAGQSGTILKTGNGGAKWEDGGYEQAALMYDDFKAISALDADNAWAAGNRDPASGPYTFGVVARTVDGGSTWKAVEQGNYLEDISAVDADTAWVVGCTYSENIVIRTIDGGDTWQDKTPGGYDYGCFTAVYALDADIVWVVGLDGIILKTENGGGSWHDQSTGTELLYDVAAIDGNTAWAAGANGTILKTEDGGATWMDRSFGTSDWKGVCHAGGDIAWVSGVPGPVARTTDSGVTWEETGSVSTSLDAVAAFDADTAWAVGDYGIILHTSPPYVFYLAEGYTGAGFQEYLCLGNPQDNEANVDVTYIFSDGTTQLEEVTVPGTSRATVNVNQSVGADKEVSCRLQSDQPIMVERPMYFAYNSVWAGGHDTVGAVCQSCRWYFAEGYTGPGFDEWICVLNSGDADAQLIFNFQTQEEGLVTREGYAVPAHSRSSFRVNDVLGANYQSSLELWSSQPVVVERPMYFDYSGLLERHWQGGHCVMGTRTTYEECYFAEGTTRPGFDEWITIQNAHYEEITVQATYHLGPGQGGPVTADYTIPVGTRHTIFVENEVGSGKDVSVQLKSDGSFLAERPMYFDYNYIGVSAQGGHCVIGAPSYAPEWFFAEGYTGPGFNQWLCIQNPGNLDATIEITYYTQEAGALPAKTETIEAGTRKTIMVNEHAGPNYQLSCRVEVTSGPDIVVERPMYFNFGGWPGGHDVVGYTP